MDLPPILENDSKNTNQRTAATQTKDGTLAPEQLVSIQEREYLARVCWLLHDVGTVALRSTFDSIHPPLTLADHLSFMHVKSVLQKLHQQEVLTDKQWQQIYPPRRKRRKLRVVSSELFDTKVLVVLLQTVCHLTPPYPYGWHAAPLNTDSSLSADVVRLQLKLQEIGGLSGLRQDEYPVVWTQATEVLTRLGNQEVRVRIQRIENEMLPVDLQFKYIGLVKGAWNPSDCETMVSKLMELENNRRGARAGAKSAFKRKDGMAQDGIPPEDRVVITKCYKLLHDNVQAEDVIDRLQQGQIIKVTDKQEIMAPPKNVDRMQVLLPKIMKSPIPYAFKLFCDAIKFKYPRIYEQVMKTRKAVYKQGVHETIDVVGIIREGLESHYKDVFSKLAPLPWTEVTCNIKDLYCPLEIVDSEGTKIPLDAMLPMQAHSSRGTRVILEGFAGSGKSTLVTMLSFLWATQPSYFQHAYKFILYADAHAMKGNFKTEVYDQLLPPNFKVAAGEVWSTIEHHARDTLILVDGFEGGQGSEELLKIVQGKALHGCAILAFSRPEAKISGFVNPDYKLFNLGLKHGMVSKLMKNLTRIVDQEKEDELGDSPDIILPPENIPIEPYMELPYICTLVFAIFRLQGAQPLHEIATLTKLFQQYLITMANEFCQHNELEIIENEYPEAVGRAIAHLEDFAHSTLKSKRFALTEEELLQEKHESLIRQLGVLTRQGPGQPWKFACSLLMEFLSSKFIPDSTISIVLKSPRTSFLMAFACGLHHSDETSNMLLTLFKEMAHFNTSKNKKIFFKEEGNDDEVQLKSGSIKSYAHSLCSLVECQGRDDVVEVLAPSFPKLIQLRDSNIISRHVFDGLTIISSHPKVVITALEISLVPIHLKQRELFISFAKALSSNDQLKSITLAWSCVELMAEFLKTCLSSSPSLNSLHVEDCTRRPFKTFDAATWSDVQDFCSNLSNVNSFSFVNCKTPSLVCQLIRSLPPRLKKINLSKSSLNMICADEIGKFMETSTAAENLSLSETNLTSSDLAALFKGLKRCETLKYLSLSNIVLDRLGFAQLVEYLKLSCTIEELDLSGTSLPVELCSMLAPVMKESRTMKVVWLRDCSISSDGQDILETAAGESVRVEGFLYDVETSSRCGS